MPGNSDKHDLLHAFKASSSDPSRAHAIELIRAWGCSYRRESEKVQIYKNPLLPDKLITIPRKGEQLDPQYAQRIIAVIEELMLITEEEGEDRG